MRHAGSQRTPRPAWVGLGIGIGLGAGALVAAAIAAAGAYFARMIVIPPASRPQDVEILGIDGDTISLSRTVDSLTPGRYSLWFDHDTGHAQVGEIRAVDEHRVVRHLVGIQYGEPRAGMRGRLGAWYYLTPDDLNADYQHAAGQRLPGQHEPGQRLPYQDVEVDTPVGPAPAWLVPPPAGTSDDWAIMVHGRAVSRPECLRAIPVMREAGYTSLLISYRNDGVAPDSEDRRYALGDQEWEDVSAAIGYALDHGAERVVLMGWSMGGATVLQTVIRSPLAGAVRGIVLDSPVVDWVTALRFQGLLNHLPRPVQWMTLQLLTRRWGRYLTGMGESIDLTRLDLVARSGELNVPILLMHSVDDRIIPADASRALAEARPDLVTYEEFRVAGHVRMWNYDQARWERTIRRWLAELG